MREIKFRVWHIKTKQWIKPEFGGDICVGNDTVIIRDFEPNNNGGYSLSGVRTFLYDEVEVVQFTGLKDKNSVEIYEGDIISNEQWSPKEYKVLFFQGEFCFGRDDLKPYYNDPKYLPDFEVIGNIHEHPNLLKENV